MTTITSFLLLISFSIFNTACKKDTATICENLLEQGSASQSILKGEWEFEYFAFTTNGSKIKNEESIIAGKWIGFENDKIIKGGICNALRGDYSVSSANQISITINSITFINCDDATNELESRILKALGNSQCYVISDNELIIHYSGEKNKNILILTKK